MASCSSKTILKYKYNNNHILLRKKEGELYFESTNKTRYVIQDIPTLVSTIINHWIRTKKLELSTDVLLIISKYYNNGIIIDLILLRDEKLELDESDDDVFYRNIYLCRGSILWIKNLHCFGDIIIEKRAMIVSSGKNMKINCNGNLFNRGGISTRCRDYDYPGSREKASSGDLEINVNGIIDSYASGYGDSGLIVSGAIWEVENDNYHEDYYEYETVYGKSGQAIINCK